MASKSLSEQKFSREFLVRKAFSSCQKAFLIAKNGCLGEVKRRRWGVKETCLLPKQNKSLITNKLQNNAQNGENRRQVRLCSKFFDSQRPKIVSLHDKSKHFTSECRIENLHQPVRKGGGETRRVELAEQNGAQKKHTRARKEHKGGGWDTRKERSTRGKEHKEWRTMHKEGKKHKGAQWCVREQEDLFEVGHRGAA